MVISVIGAIISSIVVLVITVAVAAFCARRSLDLDNVAAPIVTAAGDIATLPSLFVATYLVGYRFVTPVDRDPLRGARRRLARVRAAVGAADPAPHRARVVPDPRARGRGRPAGRRDDREAPRVVHHVPGALRARARLPRGLRLARRDPRGPDLHQAAPGHARARPGRLAGRDRRRDAHLHVRHPGVRVPRASRRSSSPTWPTRRARGRST